MRPIKGHSAVHRPYNTGQIDDKIAVKQNARLPCSSAPEEIANRLSDQQIANHSISRSEKPIQSLRHLCLLCTFAVSTANNRWP